MNKIKKIDWKNPHFVSKKFAQYYKKLYEKDDYLESRKNKELYNYKWQITMDEIIKNLKLKRRSNLLEIGFGWGRILIGLKKRIRNIDISAVDISKESILICKKVLKEEVGDTSNINFKIGTAEKLPFKNDRFMNVISIRVFHFLKNPFFGMREAKRVLKKGGKLILILPNKYNPKQALFYRTKLYSFSQIKEWFKKENYTNINIKSYAFIPGNFKINALARSIERFIQKIPFVNKFGGLIIATGIKNE